MVKTLDNVYKLYNGRSETKSIENGFNYSTLNG